MKACKKCSATHTRNSIYCSVSCQKKSYYSKNREKVLADKKDYYYRNRDHIINRVKNHYTENREKKIIADGRYRKARLASDPIYKLKTQLRTLIRNSYVRQGFSKKTKTFDIVGCDAETLKIHLEITFVENYGILPDSSMETHVDHIVPVSSASTESEMIKLNHFTNLQLLLASDNLRKGAK